MLNGEKSAFRDIVLLNAGAALTVAGKAATIKDGAAMAAQAIASGNANSETGDIGFSLFGSPSAKGQKPSDMLALAPAEQKRLDHDLMRHGLGRARATVIWGEPRAALSALIHSWRPDMIVCDGRTRRMLPARTGDEGPQMMRVGRTGAFARLAGFFFPPAQGHA